MTRTAFIGFGEAGQAFAGAPGWVGDATAFDVLTDDAAHRAAKLDDFSRAGVAPSVSLGEALAGAGVVLSLVTADQAVHAAAAAAPKLSGGTLFLDMNSVAPATKATAAAAVEASGARYVDVAVMAPVDPARLNVPLLVSGPHAADAAETLADLGFGDVRVVAGGIGAASSIKMIRSVIVKGSEALTAECMLAADRAGVLDEVLASLGGDWRTRADYDLDRMLVHGLRRAAEMEEVVATLTALGVTPTMTRGTVLRQRTIGARGLGSVAGLDAKLAALAHAA